MELKGPDPQLDDGVVRLRGWEMRDLRCVRAASAEGRIVEGTTVPAEFTEQAGREFIERQQNRPREGAGWSFAITDRASDEAMGCIVLLLRPQPGVAGLGYWLVPSARGRGYASRAVRLLTAWALAAGGFARVEAWVEPTNPASARLLERCGFGYEGRLRAFLTLGSRRTDALVYSRTLADERAATFESNAVAYDRFRPGYPPETFADLPEGEQVTIVEVGCGSGQATTELARRAGKVIATEPGPTLALLAGERTAGLDNIEVHQVLFEHAPLGPSAADALFAGMSWHWVDPTVGPRRLVEVLRDGGLAVLAWHRPATEPVGHDRVDRVFQKAMRRLAPHLTGGHTRRRAIADTIGPLHETPELDYQGSRTIDWVRRLDAETARGLFATYSPYSSLAPRVRHELLDTLYGVIAAEPAAAIDTAMITEVHTFRRLPRATSRRP